MSQAIHLRLLGDFSLCIDGAQVGGCGARRLQSFLAYLVLHHGEHVSRQRLAYQFWPDSSEAQARANLRNLIYQLRQGLPEAAGMLEAGAGAIAWRMDERLRVDVFAFRQAVAAGCLEQAVELYSGDLLPDCYEDWIQPERERYQQMYIGALDRLGRQLEDTQRRDEAIEITQRLLRSDPLHEAGYQRLMRLYALAGDRPAIARVFEACRAALQRELNLEPGNETLHEYQRCLGQALPITGMEAERPFSGGDGGHNLPADVTRFVGRRQEKARLKRLVETRRLVTLSGIGGVGKTRLALAVAMELLPVFPHGVWRIDLAPLVDPRDVMRATAVAAGLQFDGQRPDHALLKRLLGERRLLFVFDNCEHMLETLRPLVEELLKASPGVHVLATSRVALGVAGEINWRVAPLAIPDMARWSETGPLANDGEHGGLHGLRQVESVQVFVERATAAQPGFELTRHNARAVGTICQRLDGIPLALELAAARVSLLSVHEIAGHLDEALWLLTQGGHSLMPHHQTLAATMDWSFSLLSEQEKILFRRLSVFAGGATLEAIQAVCGGGEIRERQVLDLLSGLVNQSLVCLEYDGGGDARFRLHEVTRQYAGEKLWEAGEKAAMRGRHLSYYCSLAEGLESDLIGAIPPQAGLLLLRERFNLRLALEWSTDLGGDFTTGVRLAAALPGLVELGRLESDERTWLDRMLAAGGLSMDPEVRARALSAAGQAATYQGDFATARDCFERCLALARSTGSQLQAANALAKLGLVFALEQDFAGAQTACQESLALFSDLGDESGAARVRCEMGYCAVRQGHFAQAHSYLNAALALCHSPHDDYLKARVIYNCGQLARLEGDLEQARVCLSRAAEMLRGLGNLWGLFYTLDAYACLAAQAGHWTEAARLFGFVHALGEASGAQRVPGEAADNAHWETLAQQNLPETDHTALRQQGRTMTLEAALRLLALSDS